MDKMKFNKILYGTNEFGYVNLLFSCDETKTYLYFDGIDFHIKNSLPKKLSELEFTKTKNNFTVEKITQDEQTTFIKINNGDIFQIYSMCDDEEANQILTIFDETTKLISTPMGMTAYEAALKRADEANQVEMIKEV